MMISTSSTSPLLPTIFVGNAPMPDQSGSAAFATMLGAVLADAVPPEPLAMPAEAALPATNAALAMPVSVTVTSVAAVSGLPVTAKALADAGHGHGQEGNPDRLDNGTEFGDAPVAPSLTHHAAATVVMTQVMSRDREVPADVCTHRHDRPGASLTPLTPLTPTLTLTLTATLTPTLAPQTETPIVLSLAPTPPAAIDAPAARAADPLPTPPTVATTDRQLDLARGAAWLDSLTRDIVAARQSGDRLSFALMPASLGRLDVALRSTDAGLHISLQSQSHDAAAIIAAAQPRLTDDLRTHGVRIASVEVSTSTTDARDHPPPRDRSPNASPLLNTETDPLPPQSSTTSDLRPSGRFA